MRILGRVIGALLGAALALPVGQWLGCGFYESTGEEHAQCGYEFEGIGHVIVATIIAIVVLAWFGQWLVARVMARSEARRDERAAGT